MQTIGENNWGNAELVLWCYCHGHSYSTYLVIVLRFRRVLKMDFALTRQVHYHAEIVVWFEMALRIAG